MKKLGKISINPEKVIKNEDLVNLKGGTYIGPCEGQNYWCLCDGSIGLAWICNIPPEDCPDVYEQVLGGDVISCDP